MILLAIMSAILAVLFFLRVTAKERKRRETARRLFLKAQCYQANNRYHEAYDILHFIRWELAGKQWFERFITADKVVAREAFMELNTFVLAKVRRH